jgi:hypothetical protein
MYVDMRNDLICRFAVVLSSIEALCASGIIHGRCYSMDHPVQISNLDLGHLKKVTIMILGEHKGMARGDGILVHECQKSVIFIDFRYRGLASDYRTEDTILVRLRHLFDFLLDDGYVYLLFRVEGVFFLEIEYPLPRSISHKYHEIIFITLW